MKTKSSELPVDVLSDPHWRVNLIPSKYNNTSIPTLKECKKIIEKNSLHLRGWDYPHIGNEDEQSRGNNYIDSWSDFFGAREYWRFWQSGQFLHLFSVREFSEPSFKEELKSSMKMFLSHNKRINWEDIKGFISFVNSIYIFTEIFEFASRLSRSNIYENYLTLDISVSGINKFILSSDRSRDWHNLYQYGEDIISGTWNIDSEELSMNSSKLSREKILWFFDKFGFYPSMDLIKEIQGNFLSGKF